MRALGRAVNILAAALACAVVLGVLTFGYGPIPPLGPALDPGRGVWTSAFGGKPVRTDQLAVRLVPALLAALQGTSLSYPERASVTLLHTWDYSMAEGSAAAALWWTFLSYYLRDTFQPWWTHAQVPTSKDPFGLDVSVNQSSLVEDLETWTLHDPANPAFSVPSGRIRSAPHVLRAPGPPPPRRPTPFAPSFASRPPRGSLVRWLVACAATAALLGLGAGFGPWFLPFVAGLAAGAARWRVRSALGLVVVAVAVGWGAALWWPTLTGAPEGATARAVAAMAGLPPYAGVGVAGTLLVGIIEGVVAVWLARAVTYPLRRGARP